MYEPRLLLAVVSLVAAAVRPVQLSCPSAAVCRAGPAQCKPSTQTINQSWYSGGGCPVQFIAVRNCLEKTYSECVSVHVWIRRADFHRSPRLEILCQPRVTVIPTLKNKKHLHKGRQVIRVSCNVSPKELPPSNSTFDQVELVYECGSSRAGTEVSVVYQTKSRSCSLTYTVTAPVPKFSLAVDLFTKSFNVSVEPGEKEQVKALWCYRSNANCMSETGVTPVAIDPSQSAWALVNFTYLLPCVCLQVYYSYQDAPRQRKCPFEDQNVAVVSDVWLSSEVLLFNTVLTWKSKCPASSLNVSAALCWRLDEHLCLVAPNSALTATGNGQHLNYNTSSVDKHPQMCVQFSSGGSRSVSCPFQADTPTWEVKVEVGSRSLVLCLTSVIPATFSAQLCVPDGLRCAPRGGVHSATAAGGSSDSSVTVPLDLPATQLCVQAWRSDPPLRGRRTVCLNYAHRRYALYFVALSVLVAAGCLLGSFIYHQVKSGLATWFYIQTPVLLVPSSERSGHVAATCTLASLLERELSATVHTAPRASTSQSGAGVADVGPLPWLYGQWEAMRHAQGKVLLVWSPEAKAAYERWRRETAGGRDEGAKAIKLEAKRHKVFKPLRAETEHCSGVAPAFAAALACLEGALRQGKGQEVALVYFQGLCHSRDVPRALRRLPRYCLPQDFRGLIQELGGMRQPGPPAAQFSCCSWRCWPRLLSKALSVWLAQRLAARLEKLLRTSGRDLSSPAGPTSEQSRAGFKLRRDQKQQRQQQQEQQPLRLPPGPAQHR